MAAPTPQVICVNQNCLTLPVPPFVPAPLPPPNNVLVIPNLNPVQTNFLPPSLDCTKALDDAWAAFDANYGPNGFQQCTPSHIVVSTCGATVEGCYYDAFYGAQRCGSAVGSGTIIYDSDPTWNEKFDNGQICNPNPPPPLQINNSPTCVLPCWLQCAPALVQSAWCDIAQFAATECPTTVQKCFLAFALATDPEVDIPALLECLGSLLLACGVGLVLTAITVVMAYFNFNPLSCPQCVVNKCRDGSTPVAPPCAKGLCFEGAPASGCCPCDPPLPYGGSGPLVAGSFHSTESYWSAAPTPLGMPLPAPIAVDEAAAITPTVPTIIAPLMVPLPTSGIAVTACSSCANGDEIDEL
jgi:hypothetical protein